MKLLSPAELSFQIRAFEDKNKLRHLVTTKTVMQMTEKEVLCTEEEERSSQ